MAMNEPRKPSKNNQMSTSCSINNEKTSPNDGEFVGAKNSANISVINDAITTMMNDD